MSQLFISYSHQNRADIARIADALEQDGYSLWWDRRLKAGDDYSTDIEAALGASSCVIVVWSPAARNSLWVRAEASAALEQDKLVQVAAQPVRPPLPFTMLHLLDLSSWKGDRSQAVWQDLGDSIRAVMNGNGVRERAPQQGRLGGQSLLGPAVAVGAGSLGLVMLVGVMLAMLAQNPASAGNAFGAISTGAFAAACLGLGYMMMRTIQIGLASRRPA